MGSGVTGGNGEVVIRQKTGTYTIKTVGLSNGLKAYGLKSASDFDFYINQTLDTYDNAGTLAGDSVAYNPEGQYDTAQEWLTTGVIDNVSMEESKTHLPVKIWVSGLPVRMEESKDGL